MKKYIEKIIEVGEAMLKEMLKEILNERYIERKEGINFERKKERKEGRKKEMLKGKINDESRKRNIERKKY